MLTLLMRGRIRLDKIKNKQRRVWILKKYDRLIVWKYLQLKHRLMRFGYWLFIDIPFSYWKEK